MIYLDMEVHVYMRISMYYICKWVYVPVHTYVFPIQRLEQHKLRKRFSLLAEEFVLIIPKGSGIFFSLVFQSNLLCAECLK